MGNEERPLVLFTINDEGFAADMKSSCAAAGGKFDLVNDGDASLD